MCDKSIIAFEQEGQKFKKNQPLKNLTLYVDKYLILTTYSTAEPDVNIATLLIMKDNKKIHFEKKIFKKK